MGLRFEKGNKLLEYIHRAMELRLSSAGSWEDHDVWRAVDDHIMVARNSKVRLERHNLHRSTGNKKSCIDLLSSTTTSSLDSTEESSEEERRKRKRKRKRRRAKKRREKQRQQEPTPVNTNATRSPWIAQSNLAKNQCSACRGFGHWRPGCPSINRAHNPKQQEQISITWICAVWNRDRKACDGTKCGALHICSNSKCRRHGDRHPASDHKHRRD